ncbi:MAG: SDR family oxidoreductase [Spirochaetales bacterium]|jgi:glucose 1-dehydrogenase|nr:SDR family oxidoreductase [Spirochaetales bacterium]
MPEVKIPADLEGQKAVITGASKGLGAAVAIGLARAGADVLVNYFSDKTGAEEVAASIREFGGRAAIHGSDVAVEEQVTDMFATAISEFGRIDICVPNSGIQLNAPFHEMTLKQWQRVIDVNLTGQFLCCREAVKTFIGQGIDTNVSTAAGKIICMSSVHDLIPWEGHANYAAAKGGVMMLMKTLAQEYAGRKIRINAVSPGAIRTPMNVEKITSPEEYKSQLLDLMPYGRIGEPEDVARAVAWLASDASDYVTGTTIYIDGGMSLYPGFIGRG